MHNKRSMMNDATMRYDAIERDGEWRPNKLNRRMNIIIDDVGVDHLYVTLRINHHHQFFIHFAATNWTMFVALKWFLFFLFFFFSFLFLYELW